MPKVIQYTLQCNKDKEIDKSMAIAAAAVLKTKMPQLIAAAAVIKQKGPSLGKSMGLAWGGP